MKQKVLDHYMAVFNPAEEGGYNVSFPDFPGCVTFGRTLKEARTMAQEILTLWIEELAEGGEPLPSRSGKPIIQEITIPVSITDVKKNRHPTATRQAHS